MKYRALKQFVCVGRILSFAILTSAVCFYGNTDAQDIGNTNKASIVGKIPERDQTANRNHVASGEQFKTYTDNSLQLPTSQIDESWVKGAQKEIAEKPILRISPGQARNIANSFLRGCKFVKAWKDASPAKVFPLYSSFNDEKLSYYEVKVETPNNNHQGLIIVSATDRDYPIPAFKPFGRTVTEKLAAKHGGKAAKVIWYSPFYAVAVDEKGKEVATVGRKPGMILDPNELIKMGKEKGLDRIPKQQPNKHCQQAWESLRICLGYQEKISNPSTFWTGSMTYVENPAWPDDFVFEEISGTGLHPNLDQFDWLGSVTGDGTKYYYTSGCGPTAWAALAAYYDVHGEPDLLYGTYLSYKVHKYENGDPTNYLEKLIKRIHDRTDTGNWMGVGFIQTPRDKMHRGVQILNEYCSHNLVCVKRHEHPEDIGFDYPDEKITQLILNTFDQDEPVIVEYMTGLVSAHYALGLGTAIGTGYIVTQNKVGNIVTENRVEVPVRYILVDKQHGDGWDDIWYIGWSKIFGVWTLPRSKQPSCPRHSYFSEDDQRPITAMDMDSLNEELYLVYPYNNNIYVRKTSAVGYPVPEKNASEGPRPVTFDQKFILPPGRYNYSFQDYFKSISTFTTKEDVMADIFKHRSDRPAGGISICTWNYEVPTYPTLRYYLAQPEYETSATNLAAIIDWIVARTEEEGQYWVENPATDPNVGSQKKAQKTTKGQVPSKEIALRLYLKEKLEEFFKRLELVEGLGATELERRAIAVEEPGMTMREIPRLLQVFQIKSGPYMFLCWRGSEDAVEASDGSVFSGSRINIAILEIPSGIDFKDIVDENGILKYDALNFAHVVLPERFLTTIDPSITVACVKDLGPRLYVAYAEPGAYTLYTQGVYSGNLGRILVIDLETFLKIAVNGEDLWPTVASSPTGEPGVTIIEEIVEVPSSMGGMGKPTKKKVETVTILDWYWGYFGYSGDVEHVVLESEKVTSYANIALLWCKRPMTTTSSAWGYNCWETFFHMINSGRVFALTGQSIGIAAPFMPNWGDCRLPVKYSWYGFKFLESDYSSTNGDYWLGPIWCRGRPDIFCMNEGTLITWNNPDGQIYVAKISGSAEIVAELLDRTNEDGPVTDIHYVTDNLGNKNIVLGWSGRISSRALNHRILYLTPGIRNPEALPR